MGAISPLHLIIVLVVAVLVIGPGKLPEVGASLGLAMKNLREGMEGREPGDPATPAAPPPATPAVAVAPDPVAPQDPPVG